MIFFLRFLNFLLAATLNEYRNTNTKLPDQKWWKTARNQPKMAKRPQKRPKSAQNVLKCLGKWSNWDWQYRYQLPWPKIVKYWPKMGKLLKKSQILKFWNLVFIFAKFALPQYIGWNMGRVLKIIKVWIILQLQCYVLCNFWSRQSKASL